MTVSRAQVVPFTVLLVDDQKIVCEGVRRLLEPLAGVRLEICLQAVDALEMARQIRPAVILQDLNMPDGDGLALVGAYREAPEVAHTSVVVLSAEENAAVKAEAFARGASDYLVKLPPPQEFVARVRHHADAARAQLERARRLCLCILSALGQEGDEGCDGAFI